MIDHSETVVRLVTFDPPQFRRTNDKFLHDIHDHSAKGAVLCPVCSEFIVAQNQPPIGL